LAELVQYCPEEAETSKVKKSKAIWTSLELNLMLGFLYLAAVACGLPVLERDILSGAASNRFGYVNGFVKTVPKFQTLLNDLEQDKRQTQLNLEILLRPINIAVKPKWLRETARDLDKTLSRNNLNSQGFSAPSAIQAKVFL